MDVKIIDDFVSDSIKVYLVETVDRVRHMITVDPEGQLIQTAVPESRMLEPFLEMPHRIWKEIVIGVVKYASDNNIETEQESMTAGKLEMTERHLKEVSKYFAKALNKLVE